MTLDPLLAKAHFYERHRTTHPQEKVYLNLDGPSFQPWVAIKSNLACKNGAALATLKKMIEMLPTLSEAFRNFEEMQLQSDRVKELSAAIIYIVSGVKSKINTRECKLCSYVYLTRVEKKEDQLIDTLVQLPLTHYEMLLEERLSIQRIPSQAEELISKIEQLNPPIPSGSHSRQIEAFEKEKRILIFKIVLLTMLWKLDSIIESYDDWTDKIDQQYEVEAAMHKLYLKRFQLMLGDPRIAFTGLMFKFCAKATKIDFLICNSNLKHRARFVAAAPKHFYSSIKLMFAGSK